jgi:hypothetical protein
MLGSAPMSASDPPRAAAPAELPDVAAVLAGVLARVPRERQPLLVALAERAAAERYRDWADQIGDAERAAKLRACADREEEIASRVEALYPEAGALQDEVRRAVPDLSEITRSLFAGRPLAQQLAIQARGERLGAGTWRAYAGEAESEAVRATLLACADLEEASAQVLDAILGEAA